MKNYVDKDKLQEYSTKLTNKYKTIFATKNEVGSPLVASTVAEMTDTNKVYVYTGSETGYTNGNWYYYNGEAWVSGGVYNAPAYDVEAMIAPVESRLTDLAGFDLEGNYTRLEYLESSGNAYVSTGTKLNQNSRVVIDYAATDNVISSSGVEYIFGSRYNTSSNAFYVGVDAQKQYFAGYYANSFIDNLYCNDTEKHVIDFNKNSLFFDNTLVYTFSDSTFETPQNALLFATYGAAGSTHYFYGHFRIYECKIYSGTTLIRDLVPVKRTSDNVYGMYDLVNDDFYEGTGTFVAGPIYSVKGAYDEIKEINSKLTIVNRVSTILNDLKPYYNLGMTKLNLTWESGAIGQSGEIDDNTRSRQVGYLNLENDIIAECDDGYLVAFRVYVYDGTTYTDAGVGSNWVSSFETTRNLVAGNYIRIAVKRTDEAIISPDECIHVRIYGFNDGTNSCFENPNFHNVCHRGFNTVAPENTIPAFALARKVGFRYVETDVQFTSDNVPVILHDRSIDRTSNGTGNIDSMTYEQALAYDFGSYKNALYAGTKIPSFQEFIVWCMRSGVRPYIELKTDVDFTQEQVNLLASIAKECGMLDKCTWISFGISVLGKLHTADPNARIGYLVRNKITATDVTNLLALRGTNEVFFLPYNINHSNIDTTTFALALAENIKIEACVIDNDSVFANMNKTYSGNVTNGYPTTRKMWMLATS